eukprot:TRINITY_DN14989_c0_g1_i1.p1 TRINITY_DN14989_c0_g1~~TRINITY_DN14989_c0_g1_i1.p1  ORF type:complete len:222 (+),score=26.17 TRINITY_DN14989_c0_g1_i1:140-805(+)
MGSLVVVVAVALTFGVARCSIDLESDAEPCDESWGVPHNAGPASLLATAQCMRRVWKDNAVDCVIGRQCSADGSMPLSRGACVNGSFGKTECWDICNPNHTACKFRGPPSEHVFLRVLQARVGLLGDTVCPCHNASQEASVRRDAHKIVVVANASSRQVKRWRSSGSASLVAVDTLSDAIPSDDEGRFQAKPKRSCAAHFRAEWLRVMATTVMLLVFAALV